MSLVMCDFSDRHVSLLDSSWLALPQGDSQSPSYSTRPRYTHRQRFGAFCVAGPLPQCGIYPKQGLSRGYALHVAVYILCKLSASSAGKAGLVCPAAWLRGKRLDPAAVCRLQPVCRGIQACNLHLWVIDFLCGAQHHNGRQNGPSRGRQSLSRVGPNCCRSFDTVAHSP